MITNEQTVEIKKVIKRFGKNFKVSNRCLNGTFTATNYRKYGLYDEIDLEFHGKIFVRFGRQKANWYSIEDIKAVRNISKIKLHRFLKKGVYEDAKYKLALFNINLISWRYIKKVVWNY